MSEKISAILDIQGYSIEDKFFPREISIVNDEYELCYEVLHVFDEEFRISHHKQINFHKNYIHGLPLHRILPINTKRIINSDELTQFFDFISSIFNINESSIGVKNQQVVNYLKDFNIVCIDLEKQNIGGEFCPPQTLFRKKTYCPLHNRITHKPFSGEYRCAIKKAKSIWDWYKNKAKSDIIYDGFLEQTVNTPEITLS